MSWSISFEGSKDAVLKALDEHAQHFSDTDIGQKERALYEQTKALVRSYVEATSGDSSSPAHRRVFTVAVSGSGYQMAEGKQTHTLNAYNPYGGASGVIFGVRDVLA